VESARTRILVVDDHEQWRRFICSTLATQPQFQIIGTVSDGLEAVQKAKELLPELIVLDIGLPGLNGIEAARRIRESSPEIKVLLVSENRLPEIAESAFRLGALGYVLKSHAEAELLPAMDAVLQGKRFVSAHLTGSLPKSKDEKVTSRPRCATPEESSLPARKPGDRRRHEVEFYPDHPDFVAGFARFVEARLNDGYTVIAIVNESHRAGLVQRLKAGGMDTESMTQCRRLFLMDADKTLSTCMVNDMPDPARCAQAVGDVMTGAVEHTDGRHARVAVCGECAPTLLAAGNADAAIRFEHLWDVLTEGYETDTLCGYVWSAIPLERRSVVVTRICAEHSAVRGHEAGA
jgi:DNA-binding NarL/FixJ family response regulator